MKRTISLLICLLMIFACVPFSTFADNSEMPDFPFELVAPEHVSLSGNIYGPDDPNFSFNVSQTNDIIAFFRALEDAGTSGVEGAKEAFLAPYGIDDIWLNIQGDWALDDVDDPVSGWHYAPIWDNDGYNENYHRTIGPWDCFSALWGLETTVNTWICGSVHYDPNDDPIDNRFWLGDSDEETIGLRDQLNEGQYYFNEDHDLRIDFDEHTMYVRCRYILTVRPTEGDDMYFFSDWSDSVAWGKDAPKWVPLTKETLAPPVISNLVMTDEEFNGYPIVEFDLTVSDELAHAVTEVESRSGAISLYCEGRVPGETEWTELQGDWVVTSGRMEMKLITLVDPEKEESEGKIIININTPLEIRARYFCSQYDTWCGEWLGEFYTDYSNVLKLNGSETKQGSGDVNGDGKVNSRDVILLMKSILPNFNPPKNYVASEADVTGDGKVNSRDVIAAMKLAIKNA